NPVLMRSYGAYGVPTEVDFRVENFPLLERGWIIALPHVRGGSELGRRWYNGGKLLKKKTSMTDFISVAEWLVKTGLTSPRYLSAMGTSAGGLLVGASGCMRPDLFRALVLRVPFIDPLSAMLDPTLPLTQVEYLEWGNPQMDAAAYDYMASYAPYDIIPTVDQLPTATAPSILLSGAVKDQRVNYWQILKYVARTREHLSVIYDNGQPNDTNKPVLLAHIDENFGHFGSGSDQDGRLKESAKELAFLISRVQG
ncbi:hypothetical protein BZG36_05197, partial [Bifiguratus adelaidae]